MDNSIAYLHSGGFTHKDLKKIFETHTNYREVYDGYISGKGVDTPWMTPDRRAKILTQLQTIDTQKIDTIIEAKSIQLITLDSPHYPERLSTIKQSPYVLYVRGNLREARKMLGIVGSRKNTNYGKRVLEHIIPELTRSGCGIISGGAYGIDAISHELTLASDGYTISVFGC